MSDTSLGPGWWLASDGKWYPPESHPSYRPPARAAPPPAAPPAPYPAAPPAPYPAAPTGYGAPAAYAAPPGYRPPAGYGPPAGYSAAATPSGYGTPQPALYGVAPVGVSFQMSASGAAVIAAPPPAASGAFGVPELRVFPPAGVMRRGPTITLVAILVLVGLVGWDVYAAHRAQNQVSSLQNDTGARFVNEIAFGVVVSDLRLTSPYEFPPTASIISTLAATGPDLGLVAGSVQNLSQVSINASPNGRQLILATQSRDGSCSYFQWNSSGWDTPGGLTGSVSHLPDAAVASSGAGICTAGSQGVGPTAPLQWSSTSTPSPDGF